MAYGFTYTLPTVTTQSNFPVVLKTVDFPATSIDASGNAFANGGGDMMAYTDDTKTTQLPLDIITFVSSATVPEAEVWVKVTSLVTSGTIYLEADDTQTTQPAASSTFGSENVWTEAQVVVLMEDITPIDHSGNHTLTTTGTLTSISGGFGKANSFAGTDRVSNTDAPLKDIPATYNTTVSVISRGTTYTNDLHCVASFDGVDDLLIYPLDNQSTWDGTRIFWRDIGGGIINGTAEVLANTWIYNSFTTRGSADHESYTNGSSKGTSTGTGTAGTFSGFYIGGWGTGSQDWDGDIAQVVVWKTARTVSWILTEYNNQSSATAWGTVGTYADSAPTASITDIDTDEIVLDAQVNATFTTANFSSEISTVQLVSGTSITNCTDITSTGGAGTFDIIDVSTLTTPTVGAPFTSVSNVVVARLTDA